MVQGVAGSGKTSIALHRLSFLGYPDLAAGRPGPPLPRLRPQPPLPAVHLGRAAPPGPAPRGADHHRRLGPGPPLPPGPHPPPSAGRPHLRGPPRSRYPIPRRRTPSPRVSRLKTSSRMGLLLQRYVEWRRQEIDIPPEGLAGAPRRWRGATWSTASAPTSCARPTGASWGNPSPCTGPSSAGPSRDYSTTATRPARRPCSTRPRPAAARGQRRLQQAHEQQAAADRLRAAADGPAGHRAPGTELARRPAPAGRRGPDAGGRSGVGRHPHPIPAGSRPPGRPRGDPAPGGRPLAGHRSPAGLRRPAGGRPAAGAPGGRALQRGGGGRPTRLLTPNGCGVLDRADLPRPALPLRPLPGGRRGGAGPARLRGGGRGPGRLPPSTCSACATWSSAPALPSWGTWPRASTPTAG